MTSCLPVELADDKLDGCHTALEHTVSVVRSVRLLIADDDPLLLRDYREYFADCGFDVLTTGTARECLYHLRAHRPDVVMLELGLLLRVGEEAFARMLHDPQVLSTPLLVVTTIDDPRARSRLRGCAVCGYYVKPVSMTDLAASLQSALATSARHSSLI